MSNVLVLGASGQIARLAIPMLAEAGHQLTLFARDASKVEASGGAKVIEGDVVDAAALDAALVGQDAVYANLGGRNFDEQARAIVTAMDKAGVKPLVFVAAGGIYEEMPPKFNEWNKNQLGDYLDIYRRAADAIEASDLDYTIIRPAWLTNHDEVDYELTQRDEQFKGTEVSRKSVAAFVTEVLADPAKHAHTNVGIDKPGTDGDKPSWY